MSRADLLALVESAGKNSAKEANRFVAEICLAVRTPASAEFLLGHLERTKFAEARAGEFARHAVQNLPAADLASILPLLRSLATAPVAQRLTLAEGLATVAAKSEVVLPDEVRSWLHAQLLAAFDDPDAALALRAINAARPLAFEAKAVPLRRIALDAKVKDANRTAALRALPAPAPETEETLIAVLATAPAGAQVLRRTAAELLGTPTASTVARTALAAAFPGASADLSLALATGLAKSDAGAAELLDLAAAGRVRPALLRHRYVALALEKRAPALRDRVTALTKALPAEDARLDGVVAARLGAMGNFKPDRAHGAMVFTANCATCHRFRSTGGNVGPSLDGISSRALPRLVEDILDPSRNVDPEFRLTTVTLKNGEAKAGMNYRTEGDRVLLRDPATTQDVTISKSDVAEIVPSSASPMPAAFETLLSEQDFFDLLDYLRNPGN